MSNTQQLRNFEFGNASDTGRIRQQNEDYLSYFECINGHVFIVCDGMGGHLRGDFSLMTFGGPFRSCRGTPA